MIHSKLETTTMKRPLIIAVVCLSILSLFSWLRLYKIDQSLFLMNDIGRDFFVMQQWQKTGKPPLLGPMTSALPINQNPIYFYILFPFFLLLNHSFFTTTIATLAIHMSVFLLGAWFLRSEKKILPAWLVTWLLMGIHPQFVEQQRLVWNPSFVGLSVVVAFFAFVLWRKRRQSRWLWLHTLSLAAATGFSYSAAPVTIAFILLYFLILRKKQLLSAVLSLIGAQIAVNSPLIFFELRHNFTFTTLMLNYERLEQLNLATSIKLDFLRRILFSGIGSGTLIIFTVLILLVLMLKFKYTKKKAMPELIAVFLLAVTVVVQLVAPFGLQGHYIFGVLSLVIILVSFMPNWIRLPIIFITVFHWLNPGFVQSYFRPAPRSVEESIACARQVCEKKPGEYFVSVQSAFHGYHTGPEFHYLLEEVGCHTYDIYKKPEATNLMAVFADSSTYEHGKTAYDELTLFGPSKEIDQIVCSEKLRAHVLEREN